MKMLIAVDGSEHARRVDNREVEILDLTGLKQFALNTRRALDEGLHTPGPQPELRLCAS